MMKKIALIAVVMFSFIGAQVTFADSDSKPMHCMMKERMHKMMDQLKLDDTQKAKISSIKQKMKEDMQASWKQMKELRAQMKSLVTSEKLDQAALDKLASDKAALVNSMTKTMVTAKHDIYNVLNDQQKQQFKDMMSQWEEKKANMMRECEG